MYLTGNVVVKGKYEKAAKTLIALSLISPQDRGVPTCEYDARRKNVRKPTCKAGMCPFEKFELHLSLLTVCILMHMLYVKL